MYYACVSTEEIRKAMWRNWEGMAFKHRKVVAFVSGIVDDESTHNTCTRTIFTFRHQHQRDMGLWERFFRFSRWATGSIWNDFAILHIFDLMRINGRMMNSTATKLYSVPLPLMCLTVIIIFFLILNCWRRRCGRNLFYANSHRWEYFAFSVSFVNLLISEHSILISVVTIHFRATYWFQIKLIMVLKYLTISIHFVTVLLTPVHIRNFYIIQSAIETVDAFIRRFSNYKECLPFPSWSHVGTIGRAVENSEGSVMVFDSDCIFCIKITFGSSFEQELAPRKCYKCNAIPFSETDNNNNKNFINVIRSSKLRPIAVRVICSSATVLVYSQRNLFFKLRANARTQSANMVPWNGVAWRSLKIYDSHIVPLNHRQHWLPRKEKLMIKQNRNTHICHAVRIHSTRCSTYERFGRYRKLSFTHK